MGSVLKSAESIPLEFGGIVSVVPDCQRCNESALTKLSADTGVLVGGVDKDNDNLNPLSRMKSGAL